MFAGFAFEEGLPQLSFDQAFGDFGNDGFDARLKVTDVFDVGTDVFTNIQ